MEVCLVFAFIVELVRIIIFFITLKIVFVFIFHLHITTTDLSLGQFATF